MAVSGLRWQMRVHKKRRHSGRRAWATVLLFAVLTVLGPVSYTHLTLPTKA